MINDHTVILPLRLAAESYAKDGISSSCVSLSIPDDHSAAAATLRANSSSSSSSVEIAILADDDGIHAFALSEVISRTSLLNKLQSAVSSSDISTTGWTTQALVVLVRVMDPKNPNAMKWYYFDQNAEDVKPIITSTRSNASSTPSSSSLKEILLQNHHPSSSPPPPPVHNAFVAELITKSIRNYYSQQILEPSVRGFLSVLEKQFARSDLYLFELMQNAVDDGATVVEFAIRHHNNNNNTDTNKKGTTAATLHFTHNGRSFTPLDVLGLSSVGLSTKSRQGKRTIGFMGVGFKAVYKRYAKVTIEDGTYQFVYQEPPNNKLGYGWVMLPMWQSERKLLSQQPQEQQRFRTGWCHFALEQARGGDGNIQRDLMVLPKTVPPLLGRAALVKIADTPPLQEQDKKKWILDWNGKRHTIERSHITSYSSTTPNKKTANADGSELITVTITNTKKTHYTTTQKIDHWLFVTHRYKPSPNSLDTYTKHTKRSHEGMEEVCGFIPLVGQAQNVPHTLPSRTASSPPGWVMSVLPTNIRMPVPLHFQGSWLLSVDRQQVQDLTDNAWNGEILEQFPHLVATMFRWAAAQNLDLPLHYQAICQLIPTTTATTSNAAKSTNIQRQQHPPPDSCVAIILGQPVSLQPLEQAFWSEPILPVGMPPSTDKSISTNNNNNNLDSMDVDDDNLKTSQSYSIVPSLPTGYYEGANSIWVPPSWFEFLDGGFLRRWLGKRPLRSDLMGKAAFHPLFASEHVLGQLNPLPMRNNQLASELGIQPGGKLQADSVWKAIQLMAAIGSSYDEFPSSASLSSNDSGAPQKPNKSNNNSNINNGGSSKQEASSPDIVMPSFPSSMADWPVFITESGGLARLDQVILPGADCAELPTELLSLLRPFLMKNRTDVVQNKPEGGKREKKDRKSPRPAGLKRVHHLLEAAICVVDRYSATSSDIPEGFRTTQTAWDRIAICASSFLRRSREQLPSNVIDMGTGTFNLLESYSEQLDLTEEKISAVLQIHHFAFGTNNHLLLKYVLVDIPSSMPSSTIKTISPPVRLVRAASAYVGKMLDESGRGADLENFAGLTLRYISSRYSAIIDTTSATARRKSVNLFALAGVQTGMSISISVVADLDKNKRLFGEIAPNLPDGKLPSLRKNVTKSDIYLPYGLGVLMNRRRYYLLDAELDPEWERLATAMTPTSAIGFVSLLLSIPFDSSTNITPSTVTAAAKCLSGRTDDDGEKNVYLENVKLSNDAAAPLRRRLFFLPPGQPGSKALDISESRVVEQLQSIKWLPCSMPTLQGASLVLLRPREALLEADLSRPDMPVVELPPHILKRLKTSELAEALAWGTQAPPPPVDELFELAKKAGGLLSLDLDKVDKETISAVASRIFDVWKSVCRSHLRDGLSQSEKKTLRMTSKLPCIPVRRVLDSGGSGNWVVPPDRCVRIPDSPPLAKNENETLKHLTVASLVASDFLCDFSNSIHNPFFRQPEVSAAVAELSGILSLKDIQTNGLINACGSFVRYCCAREPLISSQVSPLRESFSFALNWCLDNPAVLPKKGQGLKVFVKHGPGIGTKALPARWIPLKGGKVQAVINDSKVRSALLSPEMNIQLLGVLDHSENEKDCSKNKLLSSIDTKVVKAFNILSLSDNRFVVKTKVRGAPSIVDGAPSKLQLVCSLLRELDRLDTSNGGLTTENLFMTSDYEPPLIIRHEKITREFKAPGMEAPSLIPLYAMFSKAPTLTKKRCILVSGEPDDYSMELEDLILNYVGVRLTSSLAQTKRCRAATRLLSHLENDDSFDKFVGRDFADFEATIAWKSLQERKNIIRKLQCAEKGEDRQAIRELLIRAEEVFENDPDGGDSVLQSARNVYSRLEEEARIATERQKLEEETTKKGSSPVTMVDNLSSGPGSATGLSELFSSETGIAEDDAKTGTLLGGNLGNLEGRGRGRGMSNLPAWMTRTGSEVVGKNLGNAENLKQDSPATTSGRGRGVGRTLPAWMASTEGPTKPGESLNRSESNGSNPAAENSVGDAPLVGTGRGRGVSNLPAWMTTGAVRTTEEPPSQPSQRSPAGDNGAPLPIEEAKSILSSILNDAVPGEVDAPQSASAPPVLISTLGAGSGRGRGISNLPAWMAQKTPSNDGLSKSVDSDSNVISIANARGQNYLKRTHSDSPSNLDENIFQNEEGKTKKARLTSAPSNPALRVTLDIDLPSQASESEFMAWFERKVREEVACRGGSVILSIDKQAPAH